MSGQRSMRPGGLSRGTTAAAVLALVAAAPLAGTANAAAQSRGGAHTAVPDTAGTISTLAGGVGGPDPGTKVAHR